VSGRRERHEPRDLGTTASGSPGPTLAARARAASGRRGDEVAATEGNEAVPAARTTTVRMILAVVATGVAAGVIGILVTWLLELIQDLAFGAGGGSFVAQVESASPIRRVAALAVGGAVTGIGWWLLRRPPAPLVSVDEAVADPRRRLPPLRTALDACLQVAAVAAGGSLGREGAPRQAGAALGGWFAERTGLDDTRRRTLLACGAGAGLAAVYDVPLGGAVFALEVLLASTALADVLAAAATSAIATAVAWVGIGAHQTYLVAVPTAGGASGGVVVVGGSLLVFAVLLGPVAGAVGAAFLRLTTFARAHAATGWRVPVAMTGVFAALGLLAWPFPELLGNGQGPTQRRRRVVDAVAVHRGRARGGHRHRVDPGVAGGRPHGVRPHRGGRRACRDPACSGDRGRPRPGVHSDRSDAAGSDGPRGGRQRPDRRCPDREAFPRPRGD